MIHVWTIDEIHALPEFGENYGWFYGFARLKGGRLVFGEIFPGMGVAICWPYPWWSLRQWWRAIGDVLHAYDMKRALHSDSAPPE